MVYNGILMETVGISVMVSIGLLLFFLAGNTVEICENHSHQRRFEFFYIFFYYKHPHDKHTSLTVAMLFQCFACFNFKTIPFLALCPARVLCERPSREHTICVAASQLKCCKGTFISNTFSRLRHEAYGSSIKKGSVDIEKQWKRTAKEGF